MVYTGESGPGINGGILPREKPGKGPINTLDVASVDDAVRKVQALGGKVTKAKYAVPGVGWLAYCADTEGNEFGIMESDESAK